MSWKKQQQFNPNQIYKKLLLRRRSFFGIEIGSLKNKPPGSGGCYENVCPVVSLLQTALLSLCTRSACRRSTTGFVLLLDGNLFDGILFEFGEANSQNAVF